MSIFFWYLKISYRAKSIEKQLQSSSYRETLNLLITLMSSSLTGKFGQLPKRINVTGRSWFTNHEFQNFTFPAWKKLDVQSDPDNASRKRSYLHLSKVILSAITLSDMQYFWVFATHITITLAPALIFKKLIWKQRVKQPHQHVWT